MADTLFKLNTGASISALELGTWQSAQGQVKKAVSHARASGYKHIDCAYVYGNEDEVREGLKESFESGVVRQEDIFVITKLWCTYHSRVEDNLDMSLRSLGLDYVDLYLMHWSCPMNPKGKNPKFPKHPDGSRDLDSSWTHIQTYQQMERLLHTGKELLPHVSVVPALNQIENHPYLPQQDILDFCRGKGIHVTAYSPLGSAGSPLLQDEHVAEVARRYDMPATAVLLSYHSPLAIALLSLNVFLLSRATKLGPRQIRDPVADRRKQEVGEALR